MYFYQSISNIIVLICKHIYFPDSLLHVGKGRALLSLCLPLNTLKIAGIQYIYLMKQPP